MVKPLRNVSVAMYGEPFRRGGEKNGSSNPFWSKELPEGEPQDRKQNRPEISQVVYLRRGENPQKSVSARM